MVNFLQLPAYNPGNALDFRGLNSGIDSIREQNQLNTQNKLQQAQLGMQQERLGMEKEQHSAQMAQAQRQRGVEAMRSFAGHAQSIEKMTDPAQKSAAWSRLLASHPDRDNLPEIYRDPINGPRLALQEAQGFMGEADRAKLGLTKAQTAAAYAQADKARREAAEGAAGLGKEIKPYQTSDGRTWGVQAAANGGRMMHDLSNPMSPPIFIPPGRSLPPGREVIGQPNAPQPGQPPQAGMPSGPGPGGPLTPFAKRTVEGGLIFNPAMGRFEGSAEEALERGEIAKGRGDHIVKLETSLPKARASLESANAKSEIVLDQIAQARPLINNWSTGYGAVAFERLPASLARNLKARIDTIISNLGFDELQDMRTNSPTGGALGQVAVMELEMLQKTRVALDRARSPAEVKQALDELESFYRGKPVMGRDGKPQMGPDGQVVRQGGSNERRQRAFEETYAPLRNSRAANTPYQNSSPQGGQPQQGSQGDLPRPSSPQEAARLPRGTRFVAPDGSIRTVP